MSFSNIIPMGADCAVSFILQNLKIKKETTLFEWFQSKYLGAITNTLNKINECTDYHNLPKNGSKDPTKKHVYLYDKYIYSFHYNLDEFKDICVRRAERFMNKLKNSDNVLFLRINPAIGKIPRTHNDEVDNFSKIIKKINPNLRFKLLIIDIHNPGQTVPALAENEILIHKTILDTTYDRYFMTNLEFAKRIEDIIKEAGYIIEKSNLVFDDKSII